MAIALEPATGGQSIGESALQEADVIVSTTSAGISQAIRRVTQSEVSHAMLYIGRGQVIEAIGEGVVERPLAAAVADASLAVAFRHVQMTSTAASAIVSFVRRHLNRGYDYTGILGQAGYQLDHWFLCSLLDVRNCEQIAEGANLWMENGERFFCSELVAAGFAHAGLPLTPGRASGVSPQEIVNVVIRGEFEYVGHLKA